MGQLDVEHLTKIFEDDANQIVAVDDFNISVDDGEFLILVGPSGCGKSTTLRCIAGLETVTEGRITLDDTDITYKKPTSRDIAMVFQNYALYPHMTSRQNMSFGLQMSTDMPEEEIDQRVEETASMMGIEDLLDKRPKELSGGQQQRVALGRAIVREPSVFLMDEPLSNLDAKLRTTMRTELQNLQQELGITTIYVTHDQTEAMTMGDRIAILNDGELQQFGTPLECYHRPLNLFVAGFIGSPSMNFFDVTRTQDGLKHDSFTYTVSDHTEEELASASDEIVLGIRPENIELAKGDERNAITAPVNVVEPMGDVTYVYIEIGGETYTVSLSGEQVIQAGSEIEIAFPEDKIHVFDRETGAAVKNRDVTLEDEVDIQI